MITAVIAVILIICILCAPLRVELSFKGKELLIRVCIFGIPVFKTKPGKNKEETDSENKSPEEAVRGFEKQTKNLGDRIRRFSDLCKTAVRLLRKYVSIEVMQLKICVGTGDAAVTAVSTGALWAAAYTLLGIVGGVVCIDKHDVSVIPDYTQAVFNAEGKCIIKSRIVYIIIIAITILMKIKHLKGKEE